MPQSKRREDLQALKDELRSESQILRAEMCALKRALASHIQEDARNFAQLQSERAANKSVFDRRLGVASLIVSVGRLVTTLWKDFK